MRSKRPIYSRSDIVSLVVALSGLGAVALAGYVGLLTALNCSSGDGGVPYVAGDSTQASVCSATGDGIFLALLLLVASLVLLLLVYRLGKRWAARERGASAFLALALVVAILPAGTGLAFAAVSSECSPDKEAAVEQWREAGQGGDPPFECESY